MYLRGYIKNGIDKNEKVIIPMIEEIFKLLIDKKNKAKVFATSKSTTQAFKVF